MKNGNWYTLKHEDWEKTINTDYVEQVDIRFETHNRERVKAIRITHNGGIISYFENPDKLLVAVVDNLIRELQSMDKGIQL